MPFLVEKQPWMKGKRCSPATHDRFFEQGAGVAAKAICETCPVKKKCLEYALELEKHSPRYGVWGGLTPEERRVLWRSRHANPAGG